MNITANNRLMQNQPKLSKWEYIFVQNVYYEDKELVLSGKRNDETKIREEINNYLNDLIKIADNPDYFKINIQNNHNLDIYYKGQNKSQTIHEGVSNEKTAEQQEREKELLAKEFALTQYSQFKSIIETLQSGDYEPAFKALILRETLRKIYKRDNENGTMRTIVKKRVIGDHIGGLMSLNGEVLDYIQKNVSNFKDFKDLYFSALDFSKNNTIKSKCLDSNINTFGKGMWLKFNQTCLNNENIEDVKQLSSLTQGTQWCTKITAGEELKTGDYYVFIDNNMKPRLAVRMYLNEIYEIRGIANGTAQEIEEEFRDVAISFLKHNKDIPKGMEWLEKEEWNKRLVQFSKDIDNGVLSEKEFNTLLKDLSRSDFKPHHNITNSIHENLQNKIAKLPPILCKIYNCDESQIALQKEDVDSNTIVALGGFDLNCVQDKQQFLKANQLRIVSGNFNCTDETCNFDNLEMIAGFICSLTGCENITFPNLNYVSGYFNVDSTKNLNFEKLETVDGSLTLDNSTNIKLNALNRVRGNLELEDADKIMLTKLFKVKKSLNLSSSRNIFMPKLVSVRGDIELLSADNVDLHNLLSYRTINNKNTAKRLNIYTLDKAEKIEKNLCE